MINEITQVTGPLEIAEVDEDTYMVDLVVEEERYNASLAYLSKVQMILANDDYSEEMLKSFSIDAELCSLLGNDTSQWERKLNVHLGTEEVSVEGFGRWLLEKMGVYTKTQESFSDALSGADGSTFNLKAKHYRLLKKEDFKKAMKALKDLNSAISTIMAKPDKYTKDDLLKLVEPLGIKEGFFGFTSTGAKGTISENDDVGVAKVVFGTLIGHLLLGPLGGAIGSFIGTMHSMKHSKLNISISTAGYTDGNDYLALCNEFNELYADTLKTYEGFKNHKWDGDKAVHKMATKLIQFAQLIFMKIAHFNKPIIIKNN